MSKLHEEARVELSQVQFRDQEEELTDEQVSQVCMRLSHALYLSLTATSFHLSPHTLTHTHTRTPSPPISHRGSCSLRRHYAMSTSSSRMRWVRMRR